MLEGGQVALLDCGQVKQINTSQRLGLAKLVVLVNQWETINRRLGNIKSTSSSKTEENKKVSSKQLEADEKDLQRLTSDIANMVRSFGKCVSLFILSYFLLLMSLIIVNRSFVQGRSW